MGLPQHTHEMTWRCVAIVGFDALFFCNIVARWVYCGRAQVVCFLLATLHFRKLHNSFILNERLLICVIFGNGGSLAKSQGDMQLKRKTTCD